MLFLSETLGECEGLERLMLVLSLPFVLFSDSDFEKLMVLILRLNGMCEQLSNVFANALNFKLFNHYQVAKVGTTARPDVTKRYQ